LKNYKKYKFVHRPLARKEVNPWTGFNFSRVKIIYRFIIYYLMKWFQFVSKIKKETGVASLKEAMKIASERKSEWKKDSSASPSTGKKRKGSAKKGKGRRTRKMRGGKKCDAEGSPFTGGSAKHMTEDHAMKGGNKHEEGASKMKGGNKHEEGASKMMGGNKHEEGASKMMGGNKHTEGSSKMMGGEKDEMYEEEE
jgi:hypothetical protein